MLTASEIIERLGGAKSLSDELGAPYTTVASWKAKNFIPRWWHDAILAAALRLGKQLSTTDFPAPEARRRAA
jgi:hypothetical protein